MAHEGEGRRGRWRDRDPLARPGQRRGTLRRRDEQARCRADGAPPRVLERHPSHRRPSHAQSPRPHLLRGRRSPLLRHPDGAAHVHRHYRYARREPHSARHGRGPPLRPRQHQQAPAPSRAPHREGRDRRALRRPAPGRRRGGRRPQDDRLDAALPQARRRGRRRRAAPLDLRREADRLPQRRGGGRGARARAGRRPSLPGRALVRRAARRRATRVLAPGEVDEPRRADVSALLGDAHAAPLAALRRAGLRSPRGHPAGSEHGRGAHRERGVPALRDSSSRRVTR